MEPGETWRKGAGKCLFTRDNLARWCELVCPRMLVVQAARAERSSFHFGFGLVVCVGWGVLVLVKGVGGV